MWAYVGLKLGQRRRRRPNFKQPWTRVFLYTAYIGLSGTPTWLCNWAAVSMHLRLTAFCSVHKEPHNARTDAFFNAVCKAQQTHPNSAQSLAARWSNVWLTSCTKGILSGLRFFAQLCQFVTEETSFFALAFRSNVFTLCTFGTTHVGNLQNWKKTSSFVTMIRNCTWIELKYKALFTRAGILVQVTINRRLLIGRDGHLDQSEAYDLS